MIPLNWARGLRPENRMQIDGTREFRIIYPTKKQLHVVRGGRAYLLLLTWSAVSFVLFGFFYATSGSDERVSTFLKIIGAFGMVVSILMFLLGLRIVHLFWQINRLYRQELAHEQKIVQLELQPQNLVQNNSVETEANTHHNPG